MIMICLDSLEVVAGEQMCNFVGRFIKNSHIMYGDECNKSLFCGSAWHLFFYILLTVHLSIILEINPYPTNVENRVSS